MGSLSCSELNALGRHIPTPFYLSILKNERALELRVESILRIVPGRRIVALGTWQDKQVILKLFYDRKTWKRNMLRDIRGINLLKQAGIPTPRLELQSTTEDKAGGALIIDYLSTGKGLSGLFNQAKNEEEQNDILDLAIENIARCHQAGLWQEDIHLDNFLLYRGVVHLIDGADVKSVDGLLDKETCLKNLAMFVAQLPARFDQKTEQLIHSYRNYLPELSKKDTKNFDALVRKARITRLDRYEKKLFRSTTSHRCERVYGRFVVYDRILNSPALEQFVEDPDSFIDEGRLLKKGNSSTVAVVDINGSNYVLKRYNMKSFGHRLSRSLRPSRAHQSWKNALTLKMLGVATPTPLLFMENRLLGVFRSTAYYLSEYIEGDNFGDEIAADTLEDDQFKKSIEMFEQLFRIMNTYSVSHGDTKASNFIVKDGELMVLDLDAMKRHKSVGTFSEKFVKDLKRFQKNWKGSKFEKKVDKAVTALQSEFAGS